VEGPAFHAVVQRAEIMEISVTDIPSNPGCIVTRRTPYRTPAAVTFYDLMKQRVLVLGKIVDLLQKQQTAEPSPPPESQTGFGEFGAPAFLTKESNHER
jgi:hypothetical protein